MSSASAIPTEVRAISGAGPKPIPQQPAGRLSGPIGDRNRQSRWLMLLPLNSANTRWGRRLSERR